MAHPIFSETISDWIAIGSLAGSISIVVLSKFNYWCATNAKRQAKAATEQACVALIAAERARDQAEAAKVASENVLASLKSFEVQQKTLQDKRRQAAIDLLRSIAQTSRIWIPRLVLPADGSSLQLSSKDFASTLAFAGEETPAVRDDLHLLETRLDAVQNTLRAFMEQPLAGRQSAHKIVSNLSGQLEQVATMAENMASRMEPSNTPKVWEPRTAESSQSKVVRIRA